MCVLLGALKAPRARVHRRLGRRHVTMRRGDGGVGVRQAVLGRYRRRALYVHGGSGRGRDAQGRFPLAGVFPSRIFSGSFFFVTRSVLYPLGIPTCAINRTAPLSKLTSQPNMNQNTQFSLQQQTTYYS